MTRTNTIQNLPSPATNAAPQSPQSQNGSSSPQIQHNGCQQNAPGPNLLARTRPQAVKIRPGRANVKALLQNKAQVVAILGSVLGFLGILIGIVGLLPSF